MPPNFSKPTKDILGKRAAFLCSNPDCRTITAGPTTDPQKALTIGEAAHIYGALPGAARYRSDMTDRSRAEITNGIWLCRNCHKLVDNDANAFPAEILFKWRGEHEQHVIERVGNRTDIIRLELAERALDGPFNKNLLARQIVWEKLPHWEFRLIAELLRFHLKPPSVAWSELKSNLRVKPLHAVEDDQVLTWFRIKTREAIAFLDPLETLYTIELEKSWGPAGQPGEPEAIARVCALLGDLANELVRWEESVRFVWTSDTYRGLVELLPGIVGRQLEKLFVIPTVFDEGVDRAEANPGKIMEIEHILVFDLPDGWADAVTEQIRRIEHEALRG